MGKKKVVAGIAGPKVGFSIRRGEEVCPRERLGENKW